VANQRADAASIAPAKEELADRRVFFLGDLAWTEFNVILDRPVRRKPALARLFAEPSILTGDE